jgi:ABC-type glutathione transport system ATPase component
VSGAELIRAEGVTKIYRPLLTLFTRSGAPTVALRDVSLSVLKGEILGLVGESGSGKTTLGRILAGQLEPTEGRVYLEGRELGSLPRAKVRASLQYVYQNPYLSLNPKLSVRELLLEPARYVLKLGGEKGLEAALGALRQVGLGEELLDRYPPELSGGQNQRLAIARALMVGPRLLVLDEPTSALDVVSQAQILLLIRELRARLGLSFVFITHDIAVVRQVADRLAVLYRGRLVELGPAERVLEAPAHPYSQLLVSSVLEPRPGARPPQAMRREFSVGRLAEVGPGHFAAVQ